MRSLLVRISILTILHSTAEKRERWLFKTEQRGDIIDYLEVSYN